ncbi:MAG: alkene reductase [Hyphomicrobium sp.]|jgi:N-ethylmaleimide reductase
MMPSLYEPLALGDLQLPNRVFMAPLTRNRALPDGVPGPLAATYYQQRSSAGLIITEGTQISAMGKGYINTPGIHRPEHVAAWREIVSSVHKGGGHIFLQLWHVGRISHTSLLPGGESPVAPSAIQARAKTFTSEGLVDVSMPRALTLGDIRATVEDYGKAAANAKAAGFDGVEIHAANGYLIDQFLQSGSNQRTDEYGGSVANRVRFLSEVARAVAEVWAPSRIGVRLSPRGTFNDMSDNDPVSTFVAAVDALSTLGLGYLHIVEASPGDAPPSPEFVSLFAQMRERWPSVYVASGGFDGPAGEEAVKRGWADAIAYGRGFIANPDLPERLSLRSALNEPDSSTFYGGTEKGYTDYPFQAQVAVKG